MVYNMVMEFNNIKMAQNIKDNLNKVLNKVMDIIKWLIIIFKLFILECLKIINFMEKEYLLESFINIKVIGFKVKWLAVA